MEKKPFIIITNIPSFIPRQLALDLLHSHEEVIKVNPLVHGFEAIPAPRDALPDEYFKTWYEITQHIPIFAGFTRKITFTGCFDNKSWGLQTHIHAPLNIDMRYKYEIAGNQSGVELPEPRKIGPEALGAPADGLYLRAEIDIKCNPILVGFVKTRAKAANEQMVQRIVKAAELLDAGVLGAMVENGRLKTINPNDRSNMARNRASIVPQIPSPLSSPSLASQQLYNGPYQKPVSPTYQHLLSEAPNSPAVQQNNQPVAVELPGDSGQQDYTHSQSAPMNQELQADSRYSVSSSQPRWSQSLLTPASLVETHRTSMSSIASSAGNAPYPSPGLRTASYVSELAAHQET